MREVVPEEIAVGRVNRTRVVAQSKTFSPDPMSVKKFLCSTKTRSTISLPMKWSTLQIAIFLTAAKVSFQETSWHGGHRHGHRTPRTVRDHLTLSIADEHQLNRVQSILALLTLEVDTDTQAKRKHRLPPLCTRLLSFEQEVRVPHRKCDSWPPRHHNVDNPFCCVVDQIKANPSRHRHWNVDTLFGRA